MNFKDLLCITTIVQEKALHKAAAKLDATQPSLSRIVINLEKELGLKIFDKTKSPWKLTRAGEIFVEKSDELLFLKNDLVRELQEFTDGKKGNLTIGSMYFEEKYLLPKVLTQFKNIYPDFKINILDKPIYEMENLLIKNSADFALLVLPIDNSDLEYIPIKTYEMLLAICKEHPLAKNYKNPKNKAEIPEIDLKLLEKEAFIFLKAKKSIRDIGIDLCKANGFMPKIALETYKLDSAHSFAKVGIGATFVLDLIVDYKKPDSVAYFKIKGYNSTQTLAFAYKKGKKLNKIEQDFLTILQKS